MGFISELDKLDLPKVTTSILLFMSSIAPGFLVIFLFRPELVDRFDIFKLTLFTLALTSPLLIINSILGMFVSVNPFRIGENISLRLLGGVSINIVVYYPIILMAYLYSWKFHQFILWLISVEAGLIILTVLAKVSSLYNILYPKDKK
jgi:hypothetical protein